MLSTFYWFGYQLPKMESFRIIKQSGFSGVMLWWNNDFGDTEFRKNPEIARNIGLLVENIHAPFYHVNNIWLDNVDGCAITEYFLTLIDECAIYEIPTIVIHPSSGNNPPLYNQIGLNRFKRIIDRAEQKNINVAFENMRKYEYLTYVLNNIDSKRAGLCFDSGHHHYWSPDYDLLKQYGSRLMALHLHDNNRIDDQHLLPFDGTIDWTNTMHALANANYNGAISLEVENIGYENLLPEEFLRVAFERAQKLELLYDSFLSSC